MNVRSTVLSIAMLACATTILNAAAAGAATRPATAVAMTTPHPMTTHGAKKIKGKPRAKQTPLKAVAPSRPGPA